MAGVYELSVVQRIHGQDISNIYNYIGAGADMDADRAVQIFITFLVPLFLAVQTNDVELLFIAVKNLTDATDNSVQPFVNTFGGRDSAALPSFAAWGFQLVRGTIATRSGGKRIGGISETDTVDSLPATGIDGLLEDLADGLGASLAQTGFDATMIPAIVRETVFNYLINPVVDALFKRITTQNSRKLRTNSTINITNPADPKVERDLNIAIVEPEVIGVKNNLAAIVLLLGQPAPYTVDKDDIAASPLSF